MRSSESEPPPRQCRLTAEARKTSILQAARQAFIESGDVAGRTIKQIAELPHDRTDPPAALTGRRVLSF
ncbi:hypothetical protein [Frankia sp. AgKG'84/4]|uniref:hypothetical protein n=1 Tax=Frankia sp. AgKG'84/4 TaxID=573490 RepID=UPI0020106626|nr:hypothetical protein [Frankia sp. AgKG'84/4]MCL9793186.1 hypothetical protein [Frankia sp. AgKG'84/4]